MLFFFLDKLIHEELMISYHARKLEDFEKKNIRGK